MAHFRFDVANVSADAYDRLMTDVDSFYHSRAIVHYKGVPLTVRTEGYMQISLDYGDKSLDLAISGSDGYLTAFREGDAVQGADRVWYHFNDTSAEGLGGGRKRKLATKSTYPSLIKETWFGIKAGGPSMQNCCYVLSRFLRGHRLDAAAAVPENEIELTEQERRALARLIVMLCEPSKLRSARRFVRSSFLQLIDKQIPDEVITKINNWGKISRYGLHCLALTIKDSDNFDPKELSLISHCKINNLDETVGPNGELLLILCRDYEKERLESRRRRAV